MGPFIVVATGNYIGEGFDEPRLDTLLLAAPVSWEGVVTQYSGRLHRENAHKSKVIVYDYVDATVPMLDRMYKKRLKTYMHLGYRVNDAPGEAGPCGEILGHVSYASVFLRDVETASKSIRLQVPYVSAKRIEVVLPALSAAVARGLSVAVYVKRPKNAESLAHAEAACASLRRAGCEVLLRDDVSSALAIVDDAIVWYGSLPLLAFPKEDDCSLRFVSSEVSYSLAEAYFDTEG